nr:MAG TPA: hypothetical protein [Caudoviricetes sp.]
MCQHVLLGASHRIVNIVTLNKQLASQSLIKCYLDVSACLVGCFPRKLMTVINQNKYVCI